MRIAYLILCHKNPNQVQSLIKQLSCECADFYIHIDKKCQTFKLPKLNNVFVLSDEYRVDVRWATNSMIYATLNLIRAALNSGINYDFICLLSGQDFPIKSNEEIVDFLSSQQGTNFIEIIDHNSRQYRRYYKRVALYYPKWITGRSIFAKIMRKLYVFLTGGYGRTISCFNRKESLNIKYEFGSQWWCLTADCLGWMIEYIDENKDFICFFDNALTSDECVFQTLIAQSPYVNTVRDKLMFLEWDKNGNNAKILTKNDLNKIYESECLFARKFDINVEKEVIEILSKNGNRK